ncbi:serine/threonine-protein kinase LMTK1 isoform X2 [Dendropsophus ebraccatus]|uniref:serine/threonine-protein kinase LMTK1 isoform X2 n=1 Tax=Dendropsophus ebraccatus TaxID=150705 RepID=UPI003831C26C
MGWMYALLFSPLCTPSFAFSSHFDSDGAPLSELSWPSSLAVVAVSFSGLITFIFLMLACLCCKKGDIGFKELDNVEGEDYTTEFSIQSSPATQNGPEVYVLPLTEVSVPMSKQPARSVQLLKSTDLGRQSLLYLKEIGNGWFGKVLLGEVNSGLSSTQVVVKELKVSASVQEQMLFLEETQPFRVLQHPNLLQCLAQWAEITPYLLVMEFCPLGDLKGYLQSCAATESTSPDPLTLQRMGCEVCCGLLHLHKNNYTHSDLALRNCLLSADLTVKIGDYGLSHSKYRDDYLVTSDQLWVPLRWIAPELIDEVHGNLLVVDQTKASNIWSLGVTLWELFELGRQPYDTYSDRQVLCYVIKEQQLKLPKPQLKQLLSDRWYEVMQFCWLQPEQRPSAEEVHLLLSYLSVKGAGELEEEFEKRWNAMKPNGGADSGGHHDAELSSYPLLEHFSSDGFHADGDDVLTVTQTSQGLNFEYKWERGRHEQYPLSPGCQPYQDLYYTTSTGDRLSLGVSPSGYENKDCIADSRPLELVPVVSARSPSVAGDYYIRIEEHLGSNVQQEYSPQHEEHSLEDKKEPEIEEEPCGNSPSISLSMEPLLVHVDNFTEDTSWLSKAQNLNSCSLSRDEADECPIEENDELRGFVDPLGASPSFHQLCQAEPGTEEIALPNTSESEDTGQIGGEMFDSVTIETEDGSGHSDFQDIPERPSQLPTFSPHWASNISSNNNISSEPQQHSPGVWCNHRSEDTQDNEARPPYGPETWQAMETGEGDNNTSLAEGLQEDFYKAEEPMIQECSETQVPPGQFSPPAIENTQAKSSVSHSDHLPHPLESPNSPGEDSGQEIDSGQEMDPLGVGLVSHCEVSEPSCDLLITEEDNISIAVAQGVSLSPDKEINSLEKTLPEDFYQMQSDSEDEDTMELTSGVYTDLSSERGDMAPSFRSLQKQVGTPDSLDSLDMPSTASSCEAFSLGTYAPCAQPKALDSGYDTENYESPEFVLKEPQENRETEVYYQLSQSQEQSLEPGDMPMSRSVSSDLQGLDAKNPYRDSAYFSDYDSFNREEEEEGDQRDEREQQEASESLLGTELDTETTVSDLGGNVEDLSADSGQSVAKVEGDLPRITLSSPSTAPKEVSLLEPPLILREESVDEGLGLECHKDSSSEKPNVSSFVESSPVHRTFTLSPVQLCLTKTCMVKAGGAGSITLTTGLQADDKSSCNREALGASHLSKCLSPPLIRKEGRVGDSPDDDDEDEESDDSDESDEELRCYNIQEHSEESEEEHTTIPIVITDNGSCGHLRSLLKTPSFLPQAEPTDLDRKKKAVSFFDDVTVYLFDQESPTLEAPDQEFPELPSVLQEMTIKEPTNHLLDGGEFEWDEAVPIKPVKPSFITSLTPVVPNSEVDSAPEPVPAPSPVPIPVPVQKPQLPVQFSRFSVSPTALSRFSITQVADNAMGSLEEKVKTGDQV